MKTFFRFVLGILALVVFLFPLYGYVYLAAMITACLAMFIHPVPGFALLILQYGWKVYIGAFVLTVFVMTTGSYPHCCAGMNTFRGHLLHYLKRRFVSDGLVVAALWPIMWSRVARNMAGWGIFWLDFAVEGVTSMFKSVRIDFWNSKTGQTETIYADTPEQTAKELEASIRKALE